MPTRTTQMITRRQLKALERFDLRGARALTVYLALGPERQLRRAYAIAFKDLVREARRGLDNGTLLDLERERDRVQGWLDVEALHGQGLAVFTCQPRRLWRAWFLPARVRDSLAFEPSLHLEPLLDVVDEYERYAVALVNKERARLFTVFMGEIEESEALRDFVPGKHDQGGPSQARYQRRHEAHVRSHLKRVVEELAGMLRRKDFDRLIVAGPQEATSELQELLPIDLADRVAAVVPAELFASEAEILEMSLGIERGVERQAEERLVDELVETAGSGGRASCGLGETAEALTLGQVRTLVVADGLRTEGSACPNCGWLEWGTVARCPICSHAMDTDDELVERAIKRAIDQRGEVEVVHDKAARRLSEACSGIGSLLRFGQI
jgi:peptide chain release factor subunit 1